MLNPLDYEGVPFHADLSVAAGSAAGSRALFATGGRSLWLTRLVVSTDTAQRVVVGSADTAGQRLFAGYLPANGSVALDLDLLTEESQLAQGSLQLITTAVSGAEAQLDGWLLLRSPFQGA